MLALTRQNLPTYDRAAEGLGAAEDLLKGGYVFYENAPNGLQLVLIATGSELDIAYNAAKQLVAEGVGVRVVSLPVLGTVRKAGRSLPPVRAARRCG